MAGLFTSLTNASYALQTHSRSVELAGKNIANINEPSYSRQRVLTGNIGTIETQFGPDTGPLLAIGVEQIRDQFIDRQIIGEISFQTGLEEQDFRLRQALANLGDTLNRAGDAQFVEDIAQTGGGMRGALDSFFDAFESYAARPTDATTRQVVFQEADNLVQTFNRIDNRFDLLQDELERQITDEVGALNTALEELVVINTEIARLEVDNPQSALDLRDQRQAKLEEIAEYGLIEVDEVQGANGQIQVGVRDADGNLQLLVNPGDTAAEITFNEETREFSVFGQSTPLNFGAGRLPAILEVRDEYVGDIRSDLDSLANTVATQVNRLYYQAYVSGAGDTEIPEISFFQEPTPPSEGTKVTAASIALYTTPSSEAVASHVPLSASSLRATSTSVSGANELALAIAGLGTADNSEFGNITFTEFATRIVTRLGQDIRSVQNRLEVQQDVKEVLETRRGEISGVSMDEEVANLVQYQRAFQASSRYFNVISEMLETLVNGLR